MQRPYRALALLLLAAGCSSPERQVVRTPAKPDVADGRLKVEGIFDLAAQLKLGTQLQGWMPNGASYLAALPEAGGKKKLYLVDPRSGEKRPFADTAKLESAFAAADGVSADAAKTWAARTSFDLTPDKSGIVLNERNDLYFCRVGADKAVRLTDDEREEVGETASPDGKWLAYIADWNLHVAATDGSSPPRPLTTAGNENLLYGRLDWVYQEEVYGRGNFGAFWWSPDSTRIAYLVIDESQVPDYIVTDHRTLHPKNEHWRYPQAGDPNPVVTLHVVELASGTSTAIDLGKWNEEEYLIVRVQWRPDSSAVIFQIQNRVQTWLDLVEANPSTGATRTLFRDQTEVWIEPDDAPYWIENGAKFIWRSERDGWMHLYLYDKNGEQLGRITQGKWEVDQYLRYDEASKLVYFVCDRDDVKGGQLYRCKLDGSGLERVTKEDGSHSISMSPDGRYFLDTFSAARDWPRITLHDASGGLVRELERVDGSPATKSGVTTPEFFKVKTRDGFELEAMMFKPAGYEAGKRYPVLCHIYGGPHAPKVKDTSPTTLDTLFHSALAQEGYLVWICDNRTASGKGLASTMPVYHDMGRLEARDIDDGVDWLIAQGYADPERIGIWGWSYGGYQSAYCMTHSTKFKCGIIGAPVTDWRLYDSIYTERYMGLPKQNVAGYESSSVLESAAKMHGRALILHGVIDENVHVQNSLQLAHKLQNAGILFDLMLYPGNRHPITDPAQNRHRYLTMADFLRANL